MKIQILSRARAREIKNQFIDHWPSNLKVISVYDPEYGPSYFGSPSEDYGPLFGNHLAVLSLGFSDSAQTFQKEKEVPFTEDMAKETIYYLRNCSIDDTLVVHCFLGVSRSGAIGTFAREMFRVDYDDFRRENPQIVPNLHVLQTLTRVYQDMYGQPHVEFLDG